jgi:glycosyltransferase involved in cell wall biosynthesis
LKPLSIAIDNVSSGESTGRNAPGGMATYLNELLRCFNLLEPSNRYVMLAPAWAQPVAGRTRNVCGHHLPLVPRARPLRVVYQQTLLPAAIHATQSDVLFEIATIAPLASPIPVVLSVQFLQFYLMPQAYGRLRAAYLRLMLPLSVRRATRIITFTEAAKRDLVRFTGADATKVAVIAHGLSPSVWRAASAPADDPNLRTGLVLTSGRPYILYVSATYGYKNHRRLVRAFARMKHRSGLPHVLLLVGAEAGVPFDAIRAEARRAGVLDDVVIAGGVPEAARLNRLASLAVMPSLYETFGYPLLEAMACGCPVVATDRGSTGELAGDAGLLVDPEDERELADAMELALTDVQLRDELASRGRKRAAPFRWERAAGETLAVLHAAAARG